MKHSLFHPIVLASDWI